MESGFSLSGAARKLYSNVARDRRNLRRLRQLGWQVLVVWECQTRNAATLQKRLRQFLDDSA